MSRRKPVQGNLFIANGLSMPKHVEAKAVSPEQLLQLAAGDLRLRAAKLAYRASVGPASSNLRILDGKTYAFHRLHVNRSKDVADLLRRAIQGQSLGEYTSGKKLTRRTIYSSGDALRAAYELAIRNVE